MFKGFFDLVYSLCAEFQAQGNIALIVIGLFLIGVPLMVGDEQSREKAKKRVIWFILGTIILLSAFNLAAQAGAKLAF